jgi:hypothetical protein
MNPGKFVSPTGSIELDNYCQYSIDKRNERSRETVVPTDDLAFYFKQYIEPKYGLGNINVSNVASFMKDLEMNWSKLTPDLKDKVLTIMVDMIFNNKNSDYDFKNKLISKLDINISTTPTVPVQNDNESKFSNVKDKTSENDSMNMFYYLVLVMIIVFLIFTVFIKK